VCLLLFVVLHSETFLVSTVDSQYRTVPTTLYHMLKLHTLPDIVFLSRTVLNTGQFLQ